jgi:acyl-CoA reductase-like NAD-dependent aldehyde dehydrogenase
MTTIRQIPNWIDGKELFHVAQATFKKINPHSGLVDAELFVSSAKDVRQAVGIADAAFPAWSGMTPVGRGNILGAWVRLMREHQRGLADTVARETGKPPKTLSVRWVVPLRRQGDYFADEGMRLYGLSLTYGMPNKYGLKSAIHTRNVGRAMWFAQRVRAGAVNINIGTYGSEPHMPFGGFGASGKGIREPGVDALDVFLELKIS